MAIAVGSRDLGPEVAAAGLCAATLGAATLGAAVGEPWPGTGTWCPFRLATGLPCPFCGMTRSVYAAGQGDLQTSLERNPLGPLALVVAAIVLWRVARAAIRRVPVRWPPGALPAAGGIVAVAWIVQLCGGVT